MTQETEVHSLKRRLQWALALNAIIIGAESLIGFRVRSVGLLSDAGHNLIDQGALFLTLYAHLLSLRPASASRTFGYHRAGIVAAFLNAFLLLLTAAGLSAMACWRLLNPVPVAGGWMAGAAFISFFANLGIAKLLERDSHHDLNIRSAFWHMLGDAWVSFGVVASGGLILLTRWYFLDPLVSLVIVFVVVKGAWTIFKESMNILMESAPDELPVGEIAAELRGLPGVTNVHDFHAWQIKPGLSMVSVHVATDDGAGLAREQLLHDVLRLLLRRFKVRHATVQIENDCCHSEKIYCDFSASHKEEPQ
jgi:cobalt-zinc-cadmium efflux system protein